MTSFWIRAASVTMFVSVALGAFGAHALKKILTEPMQQIFETGVRYQMIHGLALFVVAWMSSRTSSAFVSWAGYSFLAGILIFSGSLYILSITGIRAWGAITPIGGLGFLVGWFLLAASK